MHNPGSHHEGPQKASCFFTNSLFPLIHGGTFLRVGKRQKQLSTSAPNCAGLSSENPRKKGVAKMEGRVSWRLRDSKWKQETSGHVRRAALPSLGSANLPRANHSLSESEVRGRLRRAPAALSPGSAGAKRQHNPPGCGCAAPKAALTCFCTSASLRAMAKAKLDQKTASSMGFKCRRSKPETKTPGRITQALLYNRLPVPAR